MSSTKEALEEMVNRHAEQLTQLNDEMLKEILKLHRETCPVPSDGVLSLICEETWIRIYMRKMTEAADKLRKEKGGRVL